MPIAHIGRSGRPARRTRWTAGLVALVLMAALLLAGDRAAAQEAPVVTLELDRPNAYLGEALLVHLDLSNLLEGHTWSANVWGDVAGQPGQSIITECNGGAMGKVYTIGAGGGDWTKAWISDSCPLASGYTLRMTVTGPTFEYNLASPTFSVVTRPMPAAGDATITAVTPTGTSDVPDDGYITYTLTYSGEDNNTNSSEDSIRASRSGDVNFWLKGAPTDSYISAVQKVIDGTDSGTLTFYVYYVGSADSLTSTITFTYRSYIIGYNSYYITHQTITRSVRGWIRPAVSAPSVSVQSNTQVRATWTAPTSGGTITQYDLRYRAVGTSDWTTQNNVTSAYNITATVGKSYQVQVRARNSIGSGPWSSSGTSGTTGVPDVPSAPSSVAPTSATTVRAAWSAPGDNGAAISSYDLQYRQAATQTWTDASNIAQLYYTITGLTVTYGYEVRIRATNSRGDSGWSDSTTSTAAMAPGAPAAPTLTVTSTSIKATWTAPSQTGGTIVSYDLRHKKSSVTDWTQVDSLLVYTYTVSSLSSSTGYEIQVRAQSYGGDGSWSSSATVTTPNTSPTVSLSEDSKTVAAGGAVALDATATDVDALTYLWTTNNGGIFADATLTDTTWTAPAGSQTGTTAVTLTFTATDSGGLTASATMAITVSKADPPDDFIDSQIEDQSFVANAPSVSLTNFTSGTAANAGLRWTLKPEASAALVGQQYAASPLTSGWKVSLFTLTTDTTASESADLEANGDTSLACGTSGGTFVKSSDLDICTSASGITLAEMLAAAKVQFQAYVYRAGDTTYFRAAQSADYVIAEEPAEADWFTLELPTAVHFYADGYLSIAVKPVVGAQQTQVLIDNTSPPRVFNTARPVATSTPALFTLRFKVASDSNWISYSVRNAVYSGSNALTLMLSDDSEYTVPSNSWRYTPYTAVRHLRITKLESKEIPANLMTPTPADSRFTLAIAQLSALLPGDSAQGVDQDTLRTVIVFGAASLLGLLAGVGFSLSPAGSAVGISGVGVFLGTVVFCLIWLGLGSTVAGLPWTVTVPPLLLPVLAGALALKSKV